VESVQNEQKDTAARFIEYLENVQRRPAMYFGELLPELAMHFLNGFEAAACIALGGLG
jgi:hypothetical protein